LCHRKKEQAGFSPMRQEGEILLPNFQKDHTDWRNGLISGVSFGTLLCGRNRNKRKSLRSKHGRGWE